LRDCAATQDSRPAAARARRRQCAPSSSAASSITLSRSAASMPALAPRLPCLHFRVPKRVPNSAILTCANCTQTP
jgi:hypothetical protein